jgi:hypothetical protein
MENKSKILINAIVSGNTDSLRTAVHEEKGELYVIRTFYDHMKLGDVDKKKIVFADSPYTQFLSGLAENDKKAGL